jgi:hypothetical protein
MIVDSAGKKSLERRNPLKESVVQRLYWRTATHARVEVQVAIEAGLTRDCGDSVVDKNVLSHVRSLQVDAPSSSGMQVRAAGRLVQVQGVSSRREHAEDFGQRAPMCREMMSSREAEDEVHRSVRFVKLV